MEDNKLLREEPAWGGALSRRCAGSAIEDVATLFRAQQRWTVCAWLNPEVEWLVVGKDWRASMRRRCPVESPLIRASQLRLGRLSGKVVLIVGLIAAISGLVGLLFDLPRTLCLAAATVVLTCIILLGIAEYDASRGQGFGRRRSMARATKAIFRWAFWLTP